MNEFQAIFVEIVFFIARFVVPALIIYAIARIVHHYESAEPEAEGDATPVVQ
jgi:hypothetical protein